jgi:hypothetical protein
MSRCLLCVLALVVVLVALDVPLGVCIPSGQRRGKNPPGLWCAHRRLVELGTTTLHYAAALSLCARPPQAAGLRLGGSDHTHQRPCLHCSGRRVDS